MGTSLIIKGADFSSSAVEKKYTTLYWDKNADGNYVPFNGEGQSYTTGIFLNAMGNVAHHLYTCITDYIDVEFYKKVYVKSIFNLENTRAIVFYNSSKEMITSTSSTSLDGHSSLNEHVFNIPSNAKYARIGFYGNTQAQIDQYTEFYAIVSVI